MWLQTLSNYYELARHGWVQKHKRIHKEGRNQKLGNWGLR